MTSGADRRVRDRWLKALRKALTNKVPSDGFSTAIKDARGLNNYNGSSSKPARKQKRLASLDDKNDDDNDDWGTSSPATQSKRHMRPVDDIEDQDEEEE